MSVIIFKSSDSKNIILDKNKKHFGSIKFEGFFNQRTQAISANNEIFDFVHPSIWKDTYELSQSNEVFLTLKIGLWGKIQIINSKSGKAYHLASKSWLNKKFILTDDTGELLFDLNVKYGFLVSIKEAVMETTARFDNMKEQFIICTAVIFTINEQIKKTVIISS